MARVIGIDPGSKVTGYGIIEISDNKTVHIDCGGINPPKKLPLEEKLLFINNSIKELIKEFHPDYASVEDVFFAKNAKSSLMLGHVRGAILLAFAEHKIPYSAYSPREIKQAITGFGGASKEQIQYMVKNLLKLKEIAFEDASDALAIAICHSNSIKLQNRLIKT